MRSRERRANIQAHSRKAAPPLNLSHGPGEVFGVLTFVGLVLLVYGYSNEWQRKRTQPRSRPTISGVVMAGGRRQMLSGAVSLLVGLLGLLVVWAFS